MRRNVVKALHFLLYLLVAGTLLYFAFRGVEFAELGQSLERAHYGYLALFMMFGLLSLLTRTYRWNLLIETLGYRPPFLSSFYALNIGYLANFAFPRLGEITRCTSLAKAEKIPLDRLFGTVIAERVVDLFTVAILLMTLLVFHFDHFGEWLSAKIIRPLAGGLLDSIGGVWGLMIVLGAAAFLLFVLLRVHRLRRSSDGLLDRAGTFARGILVGLRTVLKLKRRRAFLLHTALIWLCYWAMTYGAFFVLPETSVLEPVDGLFILVVGTFGFMAPVQGGIGAYHLLVALALSLYGIPREAGLTYATLSHGGQAMLLIGLGLVSFLILFSSQPGKSAHVTQRP